MGVLTFPQNLSTTSGLSSLLQDVISLPDTTACAQKQAFWIYYSVIQGRMQDLEKGFLCNKVWRFGCWFFLIFVKYHMKMI